MHVACPKIANQTKSPQQKYRKKIKSSSKHIIRSCFRGENIANDGFIRNTKLDKQKSAFEYCDESSVPSGSTISFLSNRNVVSLDESQDEYADVSEKSFDECYDHLFNHSESFKDIELQGESSHTEQSYLQDELKIEQKARSEC